MDSEASFSLKNAAFQLLAATVVHSLAIHAGINMAFSTIILPEIMVSSGNMTYTEETFENQTLQWEPLQISKDEASWVASLVTVFTPVGSLLSGPIMDRFGRKFACFLSAAVLVAAWITTAVTSSNVEVLYIARALSGAGAGLCTAALVYVSEVSHASVRPMLLSLNSAFVSFGILLTSLVGHLLPWRGVAIFNALLALSTFVIIFFLPESPVWLFRLKSKNEGKRDKQVLNSLQWLYRKKEFVEFEYSHLLRSAAREQTAPLDETETSVLNSSCELPEDERGTKDVNFKQPSALKPILLLCGLFLLQQFSGGYVVIFYAIQIFQAVGSLEIDEWTSLIGLGVIRLLMAIITTFLSRKIGRRPLLAISGIGMSISMLTAFLLLIFGSPSIAPILCVLSFVLFSSFGYLVIPWTLIGELLPHKMRGTGSGLMISVAYLLMFVTVKMFIAMLDTIGVAYMFLLFSIFSAIAVLYVHLVIPETFGKTFEEIAANF